MAKPRIAENISEHMEVIAKHASGVMVALYLPMDIARWQAIEGGEEAEELHVTLAYIPGIGENEEAFDAIREALSAVADEYGPVFGCIGGNGRFNGSETSDFMDVYYASYDSPILNELRQAVCAAISEAGFDVSNKHGFTPHITLKYLSPDDGNPQRRSSTSPFAIPMISCASRAYRADMKLAGERIMKDQPSSGAVHVPTAGAEKKPKVKKDICDEKPGLSQCKGEGESDSSSGKKAPSAKPKKAPAVADAPASPAGNKPDPGQGTAPAVNADPDKPQKPGWDTPPEDNLEVGIEKTDVDLAVWAIESVTKGGPGSGPQGGGGATSEQASQAEQHSKNISSAQQREAMAANRVKQEQQKPQFWNNQSYKDAGSEYKSAVRNRQKVMRDSKSFLRSVGKSFDDESEQLACHVLNAVFDEEDVAEAVRAILPIAKIDRMKQIVYGEVLAPDEVDAQEDTMSPEEIEKAAHYWMENHRTIGRRHVGVMKAHPVESYIAPQDLDFSGPNGSTLVKKGTWVIGVKVVDPSDWDKVMSGEYNAFSVGGFGVRD